MFGYLRFFLSIVVLLSHTGTIILNFNPGVTSVIIFYMLAGFVVSGLTLNIYKNESYYNIIKDRILRVFPLYIFTLILTFLFVITTGYGHPNFNIIKILSNIIIVPTNYFMFFDLDVFIDYPNFSFIPQAWSLGAELQAYAILPVITLSLVFRKVTSSISISIFIIASLGFINADIYAYRLIFGTLFIFNIGVCIRNLTSKKSGIDSFDFKFIVISYIFSIFILMYTGYKGYINTPYIRETCLGIIIGMPIIYTINVCNKKIIFNKVLGSLSYGVYLNHFLIIWFLDYLGASKNNTFEYNSIVIVLSVILSLIGIRLFEDPITKLRVKKEI